MIDDYFSRNEIDINSIFTKFARNMPEALFYGYQRWTGSITLPSREDAEFSLYGPITDVVEFINLTKTQISVDPLTGFIPDIDNVGNIYDDDESVESADSSYYTILGKYLCFLNPIASESVSMKVSKLSKNSGSVNLELMDCFKRLYYAMHSRDINGIYHNIEKISLAKKNTIAEHSNREVPVEHTSVNTRVNTRFR